MWPPQLATREVRSVRSVRRTSYRVPGLFRRAGHETIARGGPLCLTHHHWAYRALHADVAGMPDYENAELLLRSQLWKRGVALHTGELNLAAAFIHSWHDGSDGSSPIRDRMASFGIPHLNTYENDHACTAARDSPLAHLP